MGINPSTRYPGKVAPASGAYPYGQARDITNPGDATGTPWQADLANDLLGFQQALLSAIGVAPSGSPEAVGASQYLQAVVALASGRGNYATDAGLLNAIDLALPTDVQAPPAYFNGYTVRFVPAFANTGAVTINVAGLGLKELRTYRDEALTGNEITTYKEVTAVYNTAAGRFFLADTFRRFRQVVIATSGNYTPSPGVRQILVEVVGGGGGGGGADGAGPGNGTNGGGGGGGGGYSMTLMGVGSFTAPVAVVVGAGGAAGSATVDGTVGGTSSFGAHAIATGGAGGGSDSGSPGLVPGRGSSGNGTGGIGSAGLLNLRGESGHVSTLFTGGGIGAAGGASRFGAGAKESLENTNGNAGYNYGGGGGAGVTLNSATDRSGGAGAPGVVIVTEIY